MAIDLYWDDDAQTIMLCEFEKGWSWNDLFETFDTIKKVTDKRDYPIGAIIDVRNGISLPTGSIFSPEARANAKKMIDMGGASKGPIAIVGKSGLLKPFATAFGMLDKTALDDVYFADSMDEARRILTDRLEAMPNATAR